MAVSLYGFTPMLVASTLACVKGLGFTYDLLPFTSIGCWSEKKNKTQKRVRNWLLAVSGGGECVCGLYLPRHRQHRRPPCRCNSLSSTNVPYSYWCDSRWPHRRCHSRTPTTPAQTWNRWPLATMTTRRWRPHPTDRCRHAWSNMWHNWANSPPIDWISSVVRVADAVAWSAWTLSTACWAASSCRWCMAHFHWWPTSILITPMWDCHCSRLLWLVARRCCCCCWPVLRPPTVQPLLPLFSLQLMCYSLCCLLPLLALIHNHCLPNRHLSHWLVYRLVAYWNALCDDHRLAACWIQQFQYTELVSGCIFLYWVYMADIWRWLYLRLTCLLVIFRAISASVATNDYDSDEFRWLFRRCIWLIWLLDHHRFPMMLETWMPATTTTKEKT